MFLLTSKFRFLCDERNSYRSLVSNLNQRFGSRRHQNRWLARLEMRWREPNKSIAAVGDDIRQMTQRAYFNLDSPAQKALALNQLYKIVSLEMKCRYIDRGCTTVSEAVDVTECYEANMGDNLDRKKSNMRAIDLSPVDNGSTMTLISKVAFDRLPEETQSTKREIWSKPVGPWWCHSILMGSCINIKLSIAT